MNHTNGVCIPLAISAHPTPPYTCTMQPKSSVGRSWVFTPVETMGPVSPPCLQEWRRNVCWVLCWNICHLSGASCTRCGGTAWLRDSMPASTGQMPWFPIYPSPAELIEKRNLQDTKAHFFAKKYLYLHKTIKSEQLSPQKLLPSGAAAGHVRWSLFTSDSFAWQYSAGKFSFFCKDYFFVPVFFPSLPLRTARSIYLQQGPGSGKVTFIQPSLQARRGTQDGGLCMLSRL